MEVVVTASRYILILVLNLSTSGEYGEPVITEDDEKTKAEMSAREFGFNMINSDKIAMDRALPDIRLKEWVYVAGI